MRLDEQMNYADAEDVVWVIHDYGKGKTPAGYEGWTVHGPCVVLDRDEDDKYIVTILGFTNGNSKITWTYKPENVFPSKSKAEQAAYNLNNPSLEALGVGSLGE